MASYNEYRFKQTTRDLVEHHQSQQLPSYGFTRPKPLVITGPFVDADTDYSVAKVTRRLHQTTDLGRVNEKWRRSSLNYALAEMQKVDAYGLQDTPKEQEYRARLNEIGASREEMVHVDLELQYYMLGHFVGGEIARWSMGQHGMTGKLLPPEQYQQVTTYIGARNLFDSLGR